MNFKLDFRKNLQKLKNACPAWLIAIFIVALALRLVGIWYGLPLQLNIDEPSTVSAVISIGHHLNPGRFDWPHLYLYINAAGYAVFSVVRNLISDVSSQSELYSDSPLFLVSRFITAIFGSLTIFPIFHIAKKLFKSKKVGYVCAILLAILPIHVNESHLAKLDVAQTFFVAMAVCYIVRVFQEGRKKHYIYAGIWIGLSTSVKYNGFLVFLPLVLASLLRAQSYRQLLDVKFLKQSISRLFTAGVFSIIFFYLGTPYALLDYKHFFSYERGVGALWQFKNVGKVPAPQYPSSLFDTFFKMYPADLGWGVFAVFALLIVLFLFFNKRSKEYVLTIFPAFLLSLYISSFERSPDHYFIFLIPLYLPAVTGFIFEMYNWLHNRGLKNQYIYLSAFVALIAPSVYSAVKTSYLYSKWDTRDYAFEWVQSNIPNANDILLVYGDDLSTIIFKKDAQAIKRVDRSSIKYDPPYYVMIGKEGLTQDELTTGDRDPVELSGNSEPVLKNAELVFSQDDVNRLGPPIYIFKVTQVEPGR